MIRKIVAVAIALFLGVLFLSTIGGIITGYTVLDQQQVTLDDYPYPFIKNNVPNNVYIVMPHNADYQEFSAAARIANSLKLTNPLPPKIITDKELPKGNYNLILIGNACNNELIARELNTNLCRMKLRKGEGLLKLVNHDKTSTLIVSGYAPEDMAKAAIVITNYDFYPLMRKEIKISGSIGSLTLSYQ